MTRGESFYELVYHWDDGQRERHAVVQSRHLEALRVNIHYIVTVELKDHHVAWRLTNVTLIDEYPADPSNL